MKKLDWIKYGFGFGFVSRWNLRRNLCFHLVIGFTLDFFIYYWFTFAQSCSGQRGSVDGSARHLSKIFDGHHVNTCQLRGLPFLV